MLKCCPVRSHSEAGADDQLPPLTHGKRTLIARRHEPVAALQCTRYPSAVPVRTWPSPSHGAATAHRCCLLAATACAGDGAPLSDGCPRPAHDLRREVDVAAALVQHNSAADPSGPYLE